jgi:tetratricopeptide (TPR) repeat protein
MRLSSLALAGFLVLLALCARATDRAYWREAPIPAEAGRLNREAEAAADPSAAGRLYAQAIRLCPSNGPALYGLGHALLDQDRVADALKTFRRMNTFFPNDPTILEALAATIARLPDARRADIAEGLADIEQAVQLRPDAPEAWHLLSVLRHLDGDYARAADAARQAVALDAQNPVDPETTALYQQQETACNDALLVFSPLD